MDAVVHELQAKAVSPDSINKLKPVLNLKGNTGEKLERLGTILEQSEIGLKGISEMRSLFGYIENTGLGCSVELDLTLARGLNYYTGAIIEVKSKDVNIGSICGGGRYDDLTGIFGLPGVSGVGISFGADRIYDVLHNLEKFAELKEQNADVMIVNFGEKELAYSLKLLDRLHKAGVNAEIYPDPAKLKKQFSYAGSKKVNWVLIAGMEEIEKDEVTVKNMVTGEQKRVTSKEIIDLF
jgi:histidyl-tRNA synthetase